MFISIILGVIAIGGAAAFFLLDRKKKAGVPVPEPVHGSTPASGSISFYVACWHTKSLKWGKKRPVVLFVDKDNLKAPLIRKYSSRAKMLQMVLVERVRQEAVADLARRDDWAHTQDGWVCTGCGRVLNDAPEEPCEYCAGLELSPTCPEESRSLSMESTGAAKTPKRIS